MPSMQPPTPMQASLFSNMREAWTRHAYWTRMLLISIAERLGDQSAVTARLLQSPKDIANLFAAYYGAEATDAMERLLTEHLKTGANLITALRDGQSALASAFKEQWYANAGRIAETLSGVNPFYRRDATRDMFCRYLDLTAQEVSARLVGNFAADIQAFDQVERDAMAMADDFTGGIMRQFPQRFR